jgi:uncharacterized protein
MDRAALAARIQDILKNRPKGDVGQVGQASRLPGGVPRLDPTDESAAFASRCGAAEASSRVLEMLGATLLDDSSGPCIVVDRHYPLTHVHGHHPVERFHSAVRASQRALPWFLQRDSAEVSSGAAPLLFFDLETTGLSGGAGTYAFLVGFGLFDDEGFHTRQFFLRGYGEERALLHAVTRQVTPTGSDPAPILVTYNGRGFDVPLIDTRYQINRLRSPFDELPHVDMLFPARRLWKRRHAPLGVRGRGTGFQPALRAGTEAGPTMSRTVVPGDSEDAPGSCALTALERDILGLHRVDDVPGWEIPARYFGYARTGDASGLEAVLEHNRLDLLSLGAVSAVILRMVTEGAEEARERPDCLALGRLLEYLGRVDDAERCYCAAAEDDGMLEAELDRYVRADALHWLAIHRRRTRRFHDAADAWRQLVDVPGIDAERKREALEALAIHNEHRAKDLEAARAFALSALQLADDARRVDEVRHRLGRLSRKLRAE